MSLIHQLDLAVGRGVRRLGMPVALLYRLLKLRRIFAHPMSYMRRRRRSRRVLRDAGHRGVICRQKGFAALAPNALPKTDMVVEVCQRIFAERHGLMILSIAELVRFRLLRERLVTRQTQAEVMIEEIGDWKMVKRNDY